MNSIEKYVIIINMSEGILNCLQFHFLALNIRLWDTFTYLSDTGTTGIFANSRNNR